MMSINPFNSFLFCVFSFGVLFCLYRLSFPSLSNSCVALLPLCKPRHPYPNYPPPPTAISTRSRSADILLCAVSWIVCSVVNLCCWTCVDARAINKCLDLIVLSLVGLFFSLSSTCLFSVFTVILVVVHADSF